MISLSPARTAQAGAQYFKEHLVPDPRPGTPEDYYARESGSGTWIGAGAAALGLDGAVDARDFAGVLLGLNPRTGEGLVQRAGAADRRAYWDLTFSPPKSVSALWAVSDDRMKHAIEQAHRQAMESALEYVQETSIEGRRGKGGIEKEKVEMVAALFTHGTSREQDPQLHTHAVIANLGRRADGSWGALDAAPLLRRQHAIGGLYDTALAHNLQQLGFAVERDGARSFRISGVPETLEKHWSKRRAQVVQAMSEHGVTTAKGAEKACLDTRRRKESIPQDELRARWAEEAFEHGLTASRVQDLAAGWAPTPDPERTPQPMPEPADLWRELTERASTVTRPQIEAAVFQRAQGVMSAEQARQWVDDLLADPETVKLRGADGSIRYTSRELLDLERGIVDGARSRQQERHAVPDAILSRVLDSTPSLSDEQRRMVEHITGNEGVTAVQGRAGTGKSYALGVARQAWETSGRQVIGCALAGKAAQGLEEGSGIQSQTLHSLLQELDEGRRALSRQHVIVLDEAGMVGSRQMVHLLSHAEQAGAKVVLVGDAGQLQPIDAGGSFRGITREIGAAELRDIRRQRAHWAREAVAAFADGEAGRALQAYRERGLVKTAPDHDQLIRDMVADWKTARNPAKPGESLLIAATRRDVSLLNQAAREALADTLHGPALVHEGREYQAGDRVLFTRNSRRLDVKNGTLGSVISVEPEARHLTVRTDDGRTVEVDLERYQSITHGYAVTAHKSQGVTVDHAFVLADERMSGREWSYVAASRARESTHIYADSALVDELDQVMSRSQQKDMAIDYTETADPAEEIVSPTRGRDRGFELEV